MAARNALMGFGPNGGYFTDDGQIDAYRSMWTPGSFTGMVAPNQEVGGTGDARTGELPDSNQLPADFWSRLGFTGQAYMQDGAGEQQTGMTRATPELAAWAAANGIEPGFTEGYGGVLQNGQIVPGSAFGNRSNDDANFIAGALGLGAFGGLAAAGGGATTGGLQGAIAQGALTGGAAGGGAGALGATGQLGLGLGAVGGTAAAGNSGGYQLDPNSLGGANYTGTNMPSNTGTSLADFFSGNGNLSDYGRLAQGVIGAYSQNRAADAAQQGQSEANALMRQMYEQNRADNQPLLDMRNKTLPQIQNLLANPSSITSDPGYQFGLQQGQSQIDNQAAARGGYYSGAQLKASQRYGQDYAGTKLTDSLNRLMGVAGLGQVGATANQSNNTNYSQMGGNGLMQQGNIRGSGYIGQGAGLNNAIGGWLNDRNSWDAWNQWGAEAVSIVNLLAAGPQYQQIEPRVNALMQAQQARGMQQRNLLMQQQMQAAQAEQAQRAQEAQQNALMQRTRDAELSRLQGGGEFDPLALYRAGVPEKQIEFLANRQNLGRPEVARTEQRRGSDGNPETVMLDRFGGLVGNALPQAVKLDMQNLGGTVQPVNPYTQTAPLKRTQTPDSVASNAVTMRGQNMQNDRAMQDLALKREAMAQTRAGGGNARTGPMSVTLQKELLESDDAVQSSASVVRALQAAKAQNEKAYDGYFAKSRAQLVSNTVGSESADATIDIDNLMTGQGLDQMKAIFGAAPTEGERKILMDMQASVDKTPKQRAAIMDRAIAAAQRRAEYASKKAAAIRDGSYLTDGIPASAAESPKAGGGVVDWGSLK